MIESWKESGVYLTMRNKLVGGKKMMKRIPLKLTAEQWGELRIRVSLDHQKFMETMPDGYFSAPILLKEGDEVIPVEVNIETVVVPAPFSPQHQNGLDSE